MAKINGKDVIAEGLTLKQYLIENGYNLNIIAVERNEKMVSKEDYDNIYIMSNDIIEVVSFVGGGSC
jgi:sulfur carrier protein